MVPAHSELLLYLCSTQALEDEKMPASTLEPTDPNANLTHDF